MSGMRLQRLQTLCRSDDSRHAPANLCAPGGAEVAADLAALLGRTYLPPSKFQTKATAFIDESACIGCTACIRACPVDAIMGASKLMHTVIQDECTGCGLCVAPCPVDCIDMQTVSAAYLPQAQQPNNPLPPRFAAAEYARIRFENQTARRQRDEAERKALIAEREAAVKAKLQTAAPQQTAKAAFNPADLIAKAMSQAQSQQSRLASSANREDFKAKQIREAKERAELRRAQRDATYGSGEAKAAAIEYLRRRKAEQEAAEAAKS